jgi:hypothetical protein
VRCKNENNDREKYQLILTKFQVTTNYLLQPIPPHKSKWSQKSLFPFVFDRMYMICSVPKDEYGKHCGNIVEKAVNNN